MPGTVEDINRLPVNTLCRV